MNHGIVSSGRQSNFLNYFQSNFPMTKSITEPCSYFGFHPHIPKLSFSLKTRQIKASVQSLYASTESFYDLLGIPESVTPREIKYAYKQLVLKYYLEVSPPERVEENTKWFIQLQEAYKILSDPKSRALYDYDLATGSLMAFPNEKMLQDSDDKVTWRIRWQSQLTKLKRKGLNKDNVSWGARIRRQRIKTSDDLI